MVGIVLFCITLDQLERPVGREALQKGRRLIPFADRLEHHG